MAVLVVTLSFNMWQRRLAREQLRHQLYDRRIAVYIAFRELLLGLAERDNEEIKALFRKACVARFEVPFLFEDDKKLKGYLEQVCKRTTDEVINNIFFVEGMKQAGLLSDPDVAQEFARRASQLSAAKLQIADDHLTRLPQEFAAFLKLTDFKKQ